MKGIKVTEVNLLTIFGNIKNHLSDKDHVIDILEIENVSTYNQAKKALQNPTDSYKAWNHIEFSYHNDKKDAIDIGNQFASEHAQHVTLRPFWYRPDAAQIQSGRSTSGDTIWITPQGIFIKTWRGSYEETMFYVIR